VVVMMGTWVSWAGSNWNSGQVVTSMVSESVVAGKVVAPKQSKEKSKSVLNSEAELVSN